jgi:hypothetical protein
MHGSVVSVAHFVYDGDGNRVAQVYSGTYTSTMAYFGNLLEITAIGAPPVITPTTIPPTMTYHSYLPLVLAQRVGRSIPLGNETWKQYYAAGNQVVALREFTTSLTSTLYYLSSDHLGSASAIVNDSGRALERCDICRVARLAKTDLSLPSQTAR